MLPRVCSALFLLAIVASTASAQNSGQAALQNAFVGKQVTLQIDMPGTQQGVDLRMERDDPALAYAFHKLVIRTLATRLDFANREVAGLRR